MSDHDYDRAVERYHCLIDLLQRDKAANADDTDAAIDYAVVDQCMTRLNGWPANQFYHFQELYGDDVASWLDSPHAYAIYKAKRICAK